MNIRRISTLALSLLATAGSSAQSASDASNALKLSQCGELSLHLSELSPNASLKEQRAAASLRYLLPIIDLVPVEAERKAIAESAAKAIEQQSRALRESKRPLAEAYESVRLLFLECNQIRANLDAARASGSSASAPR